MFEVDSVYMVFIIIILDPSGSGKCAPANWWDVHQGMCDMFSVCFLVKRKNWPSVLHFIFFENFCLGGAHHAYILF